MGALDIRRPRALLALGAAALSLFALGASPAQAARVYERSILSPPESAPICCGFGVPIGLDTDGEDNIWIEDQLTPKGQSGVISVFDPDGHYLFQHHGGEYAYSGYFVRDIAVDHVTRYLYVADGGDSTVKIYDQDLNYVDTWTGLADSVPLVAVDNSGLPSQGRVYVSDNGTKGIHALDAAGNPVNFTEPGKTYIEGNHLTGTSDGPFTGLWKITVGPNGHIYVIDAGKVHEFEASGLYVRTFAEAPSATLSARDVAVDPTNGHLLIVDDNRNVVEEFTAAGEHLGTLTPGTSLSGGIAVDSQGFVYFGANEGAGVLVFSPNALRPVVTYAEPTDSLQTSVTLNGNVDPNGGGTITDCYVQYGLDDFYGKTAPCDPALPYADPTAVSSHITGLDPETVYHYRIVATGPNGTKKGAEQTFRLKAVTALSTDPATEIQPTSATLNGSFLGNGENTRYYFEWGINTFYGKKSAIPPGAEAGETTGPTSVSFDIGNLIPITTYHFRIVATNSYGTTVAEDGEFSTPPDAPVIDQWSSEVHGDTAVLNAEINPRGAETTYRFEYGTTSAYGNSMPIPDGNVGSGLQDVEVSHTIEGLEPGVTYHYRTVAENSVDITEGPDRTFTTFAFIEILEDPCSNAQVRQQTGAALVPNCRAYELVSAADAGGYSVTSNLVAGQDPYPGYRFATAPSRVLYTVNTGAIPGDWNPTNYGRDPYLATREADGWSTNYLGIEAHTTETVGPFASEVSAANPHLNVFAFGGPQICAPCFPDGTSGIPIKEADGELVQGMVGSLDPGPSANADIMVNERFSADGRYLIFGSTSQFEPDAPDGAPAIYKRNLESDTTEVVSKTPGGDNIACLSACATNGVAALSVSTDGSRVLIGQLLGVDADANNLWHPFINVDGVGVDLAPATTAGVNLVGMSANGTRVLFTSTDQLTVDDDDASADLFAATVGAGSSTLVKLSPSNSDACDPVSNSGGSRWNSSTGTASCSVAAISGMGGVGAEDGTAYFLSPEQLDNSEGESNQPNLYVVRPGQEPRLLATLEPNNPAVLSAVNDTEKRRTSEFEVTPSGEFAIFTSKLPLTGYDNDGHVEIYRFEATAGELDCTSCPITGARAMADAELASHGSSITEDGRVFFTTTEHVAANDLSDTPDVYQWQETPQGPEVATISTGTSLYPARLLSVSADGTDVYFFTRDSLARDDKNGQIVKIYDARAGGGFLAGPPEVPCLASDECHGPSSKVAPHPDIGSLKGTGGNEVSRLPRKCAKGKVRRRGRCVSRKASKRSKRTNHAKGRSR